MSSGGDWPDQDYKVAESLDGAPSHAKWLIYKTVAVCSLTSMLLGYDVGVMAGALPNIADDLNLNTTQTEVIAGSLNIVAGLCSFLAAYAADRLGRRAAIAIACVVFGVGATIMVLSFDFYMLFAGRVVTGAGVGFGLVIAPTFLSEIVPPERRGFLVSLFDVVLNAGILAGYVVGYVVQITVDGPSARWRTMVAVGIVPPVLILLGLWSLPESPRWLTAVGRGREAVATLSRILPDRASVPRVHGEIRAAIEAESANTYREILCPTTRGLRRALHISLGLAVYQQITGSEAVIYYTPEIMKSVGITDLSKQLLYAMPVGVAKLSGELVSVPLLDTVGRRPILIVGGVLQAVFLALLAMSFAFEWGFAVTLSFVCLFMFSFEIGGPIPWLMPSEVYSTGKRGRAMSAVVTLNRLVSGSVAISFLSLSKALSVVGVFSMFAGLAAVVTLWAASVVPETKGLTLEEVTQMLDSGGPPLLKGSKIQRGEQFGVGDDDRQSIGGEGWQAEEEPLSQNV